MTTQLIRPGLLVSLKTTLRGGVTYATTELESDHAVEGREKARAKRWETERQIADIEEHERAVKARTAARQAIVRVCRSTTFGLLCPEADEPKLLEALREAQVIAATHNDGARYTFLEVFALTGRIAASDEEAAKAIASEVRSLIDDMERGVRAADPVAIRDAASRARQIAGMLTDGAQGKVSAAIEEVRGIAREIVRRAGKAGEVAADVVKDLKLNALASARFAVLDLAPAEEEAQQQEEPTEEVIPVFPRAIDFEPLPLQPAPAPTAPAPVPNPFLDL